MSPQKLQATEKELDIIDARRGINAFCEYVIKDDKGNKIRQAEIHRSWHEHIEKCRAAGKHAGIIAPWGHAKSVQMAIALPLKEIGDNPNIRIKIVSCDDDLAIGRVNTIKQYIELDDDYHAVYPGVQKTEDWAKHSITVRRSAAMADPTLEANGVLGSSIGGRCRLLIFDDPHNLKTGVLEPSTRQKVKESAKVWISRLEPGGFCIYIATVWHEEDLTYDLIKNQAFGFLIQAVNDDCTKIFGRTINI
jgi:hypothetical protein